MRRHRRSRLTEASQLRGLHHGSVIGFTLFSHRHPTPHFLEEIQQKRHLHETARAFRSGTRTTCRPTTVKATALGDTVEFGPQIDSPAAAVFRQVLRDRADEAAGLPMFHREASLRSAISRSITFHLDVSWASSKWAVPPSAGSQLLNHGVLGTHTLQQERGSSSTIWQVAVSYGGNHHDIHKSSKQMASGALWRDSRKTERVAPFALGSLVWSSRSSDHG